MFEEVITQYSMLSYINVTVPNNNNNKYLYNMLILICVCVYVYEWPFTPIHIDITGNCECTGKALHWRVTGCNEIYSSDSSNVHLCDSLDNWRISLVY